MNIGVQGVLLNKDKNKVLLIKRRDFPVWTLPGGRVEKGETSEQAILREFEEETGLQVRINRFIGQFTVWYFPWVGKTKVYRCSFVSGRLHTNLEVEKIEYDSVKSLPKTLLPYIKQRIRESLK